MLRRKLAPWKYWILPYPIRLAECPCIITHYNIRIGPCRATTAGFDWPAQPHCSVVCRGASLSSFAVHYEGVGRRKSFLRENIGGGRQRDMTELAGFKF